MKKNITPFAFPLIVLAVSCSSAKVQMKPNVVLIVADDLGMGDIGIYGAQKISTPNIDFLGRQGVCFQNAYSTSATSTPSRYAMLTGIYPWRNKDAKILPGDAPLLIADDTPTLPKMFQSLDYNTAAIGKWHLGMGDGNVDWNKKISPNANDVGFDYTYLIAATNDRVPTVYVKNGHVEGLDASDPIYVNYKENFDGEPTALTNPEMLKMKWHHGHNNSIVNGIPRIGFMKGGEKARWIDENMADYFVNEIKQFINRQTADKPFFLYFGLHQPHVPRTPHERFVGSTDLGPRGDVIVEADWCVGELISCLDTNNLLDNTIIIFTSDNGPVINDGYIDGAEERLGDHDPLNGLRGGKYSLYDGGTHVPMIIYWKGKITPKESPAIVSQLDLFASLAHLVGGKIPKDIDSREYLDAFMGKSDTARDCIVLEAQGKLAYRYGDYALIPPYEGPETNVTKNELGNRREWSLYDLKNDKSQNRNIAGENTKIFEKMKNDFMSIAGIHYLAINSTTVH